MQISPFFIDSVLCVLFLQIIKHLKGQPDRLFNSRKIFPNGFAQQFFDTKTKPQIPSFLSNQLAWAYVNHEAFMTDDTTHRPKVTERPRQYNQKGKVFGYCDIGNDEDLDNLFPGMFQSETEILSETSNIIKKERWYANKIRSYGPPKSKLPQPTESSTQNLALVNNVTEVKDKRPLPLKEGSPVCQCCQTNSMHEVYRNITVDNKTYNVIQLPGKFQAIPVGRCPQTNLCLYGGCVQHYSVHHVLIWNSSVPYWPPFDFALLEYPTHCTWENIGQ